MPGSWISTVISCITRRLLAPRRQNFNSTFQKQRWRYQISSRKATTTLKNLKSLSDDVTYIHRPRPASSFRSAQAAILLEFHVPLTNCFVCRWFCAVHGPKPPLHRHNWLSSGKFQATERFLIHCACHFSSWLPPIGGTCKYAKVPSTKQTLRDSLPIDMLLSALSFLVVAQSSSEVPEGLMNNPVLQESIYIT